MQFLTFCIFFVKLIFKRLKTFQVNLHLKKKKSVTYDLQQYSLKIIRFQVKKPHYLPNCYSDKDIKGYRCESDRSPCKLRPKAT